MAFAGDASTFQSATRGEGCPVIVTINVAILLAVVIFLRLQRRVVARSRNDERLTVVIVLVFGVLIAPTGFGKWVLDVVGQLVRGLSHTFGR
jgi:hypothetical protein